MWRWWRQGSRHEASVIAEAGQLMRRELAADKDILVASGEKVGEGVLESVWMVGGEGDRKSVV